MKVPVIVNGAAHNADLSAIVGDVEKKVQDAYIIIGGVAKLFYKRAITWTISADDPYMIKPSGEALVDCSNSNKTQPGMTIRFDEGIYVNYIGGFSRLDYGLQIIPTGEKTTGVALTSFWVIYDDNTQAYSVGSINSVNKNKPVREIMLRFDDPSSAADQEVISKHYGATIKINSRDYGTFYINGSGTSDQ